MDFQSNNRSGNPENNGEPYNENPLNNGNPYDNTPVNNGNRSGNNPMGNGNRSDNNPMNSGNRSSNNPMNSGNPYNNTASSGNQYGNNPYNNANQHGPYNGNPYNNPNQYGNSPYNGNPYNSDPYNNPYGNGNPYNNGGPYGRAYTPIVTPQKGSGMATAAMILGIISLISLLLLRVYIPFLIGGIGIILAILSRGRDRMSGRAKAGIICCITSLVLDVALCALSVYLLFALPDIMPEMMDDVDKICEQQYGMSYEEFMDQIYEMWDIER